MTGQALRVEAPLPDDLSDLIADAAAARTRSVASGGDYGRRRDARLVNEVRPCVERRYARSSESVDPAETRVVGFDLSRRLTGRNVGNLDTGPR